MFRDKVVVVYESPYVWTPTPTQQGRPLPGGWFILGDPTGAITPGSTAPRKPVFENAD